MLIPSWHTAVISETLAVSENIRVNTVVAGETPALREHIKVKVTEGKAPISLLVYVALSIFGALIILLVIRRIIG